MAIVLHSVSNPAASEDFWVTKYLGLAYIAVLLANARENKSVLCDRKLAWWIIMRLYYKCAGNLPLYTVNYHVFSSREENIIKVNSTGGLCCILASHPRFFYFFYLIFVCQVSAVLPTVATNTKPTRLSIPDTKLQSSQVPGGKAGVQRLGFWDVLWMATNCCAACQHVKPGALGRKKWKINRRLLPERSRDCNTWERRWRRLAWGAFQQMHRHVTLNYSIAQILYVFLLFLENPQTM